MTPNKSRMFLPLFAAQQFTATAALSCFVILGSVGCKSTGPKADDASLKTAVQQRLSSDAAISAEPIETTVQNGVVTLSGTVSGAAARSLAANDAAQIAGIRTVVNNLAVQSQQAQVLPSPAPVEQATIKPAPKPSASAILAPRTPAKRDTRQPDLTNNAPQQQNNGAPIERSTPTVAAQVPAAPAAPAFRQVTVPSGTSLPVRITENLDSATTQQGENFTGTVASDIIVDGLVAIAQGTRVTGRVDAVQEAAHYKGSSLLTIELTSMNPKGERISINTEPFSKEGAGRGKNTAVKTGGGAAVGAILGGIFGGGKGAAIGAASGAAVGAGANTVTRGQQVQIPSESLISFRLTNSIAVRASTREASNRQTPPENSQRRPLEPAQQPQQQQ